MNNGGTNWQAEAQFWKQKYVEQMVNHAQVVAALMRPTITEMPGVGTEPAQDKPATRNGANRTGAKSL